MQIAALVVRDGQVRSFHVPNVTANNLYPIVARHTHADSRFMTDDTSVYTAIGRTFKGGYETVNHSAKEYVRDDAYTNTAEGYFSILKRGVYGIYQHVCSEAHLHRYLGGVRFPLLQPGQAGCRRRCPHRSGRGRVSSASG